MDQQAIFARVQRQAHLDMLQGIARKRRMAEGFCPLNPYPYAAAGAHTKRKFSGVWRKKINRQPALKVERQMAKIRK
ncbi:hypothetical protein D3C81_1943070 [compost metagenome]